MKNTVVLGLLAEWLGFAPEALLAGLSRKFAKKGPAVLEANERAFAAGRGYAADNPLPAAKRLASMDAPPAPKLLTDGNEMCGAAAIFAGCTFFGGYPITPSTEIMQYLGREIWKYGGVVFQAEDEIAGIAAVVGASFAGKKAMTATSGPGMSLKTEVLRPVLGATTVRDMFATTVEAFNIAEEYQTPVILLSDADIGQRKEVVDPIDPSAFRLVERRKPTLPELEKYQRFVVTESGISPLSEPGMPGGNYLASGIEPNESGAPTGSGAVHATMNEKRLSKFATLMARRDLFETHGPFDAPIGIVSWGRVSGVAREALDLARRIGVPAKLLVPRLLYPVAQQAFEEFFASVRTGFVVEQSHQGQLYRLLRMFVELPQGMTSLSRSGSNPFTVLELMNYLRDRAIALERAAIPELETQSD